MKIDKSNNNDSLISTYERRLSQKDKRKRARMKVSGGSVKKLKQLIGKK
ncbi:MAG: hypothetical protein WCV41_00315 [Patescibacteria group bacterium]|jgi:hypothetical protein